MTIVDLTILMLFVILAIMSVAIAILARRMQLGLFVQVSGLILAVSGLILFFYGARFLPVHPVRYVHIFSFSLGYGGQAIVALLLALKLSPVEFDQGASL